MFLHGVAGVEHPVRQASGSPKPARGTQRPIANAVFQFSAAPNRQLQVLSLGF